MIWGGNDLTVGPAAMAALVTQTRTAYPDLVFEITQVCICFCVWMHVGMVCTPVDTLNYAWRMNTL